MLKEGTIKEIRSKFMHFDMQIQGLNKLIGSLVFSLLALNDMVDNLVDDRAKKKAFKHATEQLGRMKAMVETQPLDGESAWDKYNPLVDRNRTGTK